MSTRDLLIDFAGHDRLLPVREGVRSAGAWALGLASRRTLTAGEEVPGLLSVVVPAYGVERYIAECLESLQRQNYRKVEIIVVDDGSPDRSGEIARRMARRDARIRVTRRVNGGLSAARNTGAALARGEFITFIDSDDTVDRHAFTQAIDALRATGSDFAVSPYRRAYKTSFPAAAPWVQNAHSVQRLACTLEEFPDIQVNAVAWSKVYRRRFWLSAELRFPEGALYEDQAVSARAFARARSFDVLSRVSLNWRIRDDQSSISQQTTSLRNISEHRVAVEQSLAELDEFGHTAARNTRVAQLISNNLTEFFLLIRDMEDDAWRAFSSFVDYLVQQVDSEATWNSIDARSKVMSFLVARGDRERALHFLVHGWRRELFAGHRAGSALFARLPYWDDPEAGVPAFAYRLSPRETTGRAVFSSADHEGDELTLDVIAFIEGVDPDTDDVEASFSLVAERGEREIPLEHESIVDPMRTRGYTRLYNDQSKGLKRVRIPLKLLGTHAEDFRVLVRLHAGEVEREAHLLARHLPADGRLAPAFDLSTQRSVDLITDERKQLIIRTADIATRTTQAALIGKRLRVRLEGSPVTRVAFVHLADRFGLRRSITAVEPRSGRPVDVSLKLPTFAGSPAAGAGAAAATWIVVAEDTTGTWSALYLDDDAVIATRSDDTRYRIARVVNGRTSAAGADVPGGSLRIDDQRDTALVESIDVDDDSLVLRIASLDDTAGAPVLVSGSNRITGVADGDRVTFHLELARWGVERRPAPNGSYGLEIDGRRVMLADALRSSLPWSRRAGAHLLTARVDRRERLKIRLEANLRDEELGSGNLDRMRAWYHSLSPQGTKRSVLFRSLYGEAANDSALAVHRRLRERGSDLELLWSVRDHSIAIPEGGRAVIEGSRDYYESFGTADYVMVNVHQPDWVEKRAGQTFIETFHGYPFKLTGETWWRRLGFPPERIESFYRRADDWDYLISPASYASDPLRGFFRNGQERDTQILEIGYPRNDALLAPDRDAVRAAVRSRLGIADGKRAILYAPTFRDYLSSDDMTAEFAAFLDQDRLMRQLGGEYVLLMRGHPFNARGESRVHGAMIDVTTYPDVNDLILASDAAILDYSSLRFDYALSGRPAVFFAPDRERYFAERPSFMDFEPTAPGPIVETTDGVAEQLRDLGALGSTSAKAIAAFRSRFMELEDGHAADRLIDAIFVPRGDVEKTP